MAIMLRPRTSVWGGGCAHLEGDIVLGGDKLLCPSLHVQLHVPGLSEQGLEVVPPIGHAHPFSALHSTRTCSLEAFCLSREQATMFRGSRGVEASGLSSVHRPFEASLLASSGDRTCHCQHLQACKYSTLQKEKQQGTANTESSHRTHPQRNACSQGSWHFRLR